MKILMAYPNLPLMMAPAISVGIFNAICKEMGHEFKLFETTEYSDEYKNRHIKMSEIGASRGPGVNSRDDEYFDIKPKDRIIPDFVEMVEDYKPDMIWMSMQEDVFHIGVALLDAVKDKKIPHIIGGVFPTQAPDIVINHPLIDCIAIHEGENIVRQVLAQDKRWWFHSDGLWWKDDDGSIHKNKPAALCNIGQTTPDFSCYENKRWQRPMGGRHFKRAVSMETFRGCPYKCTFCNSPGTRQLAKDLNLGNYMRRKTAGEVRRDLDYYLETIDPDLIMFQDDSFLARPASEIFELSKVLGEYKIPFWFNTRIENCKPEYLAALKEAGVYRMTFGIESGDEKYRKEILGRPIRNEIYHEYLEYINNSDIPYSLNIIIGMPYETRSMVLESAKLVHHAKGHDGLTISIFQPYHGTKLREMAVKAGFIDPDLILSGGYQDNWYLNMPEPYLQRKDLYQLNETFALYAYHDESQWDLVRRAEVDVELRATMLAEYKSNFFIGDYQIGGKSRKTQLNKYCNKHDISSSYEFSC